jgi:wyosine [tRNA(Phe)-imidazoG37] synthetase (radical SAM superfamily)
MKLVYGPVPSRRFGISLGVDVVPFKVCTLDCAYCQLGHTTRATVTRSRFVPVAEVLEQVRTAIARGPRPDIITFAGSGEPTLYSALGELACALRLEFAIPLLLITNGTLLERPDVAVDAALFDLVAPSLDAGDEETFLRLNRPAPGITFSGLMRGLTSFAAAHPDKLRLEIFFAAGINDHPAAVASLVAAVADIGPRQVELNTAVRPTADPSIKGVSAAFLEEVSHRFSCPAVPIASPPRSDSHGNNRSSEQLQKAIFATLQRRPCTLADLTTSLAEPRASVTEALEGLSRLKVVARQLRDDQTYYVAVSSQFTA